MKRSLLALAALVVGLALTGSEAKAESRYGRSSGGYDRSSGSYGRSSGGYDRSSGSYGRSYSSYGRSYSSYGSSRSYYGGYGAKFSHGYYYPGRNYSHWSYRSWNDRYRCYT